MGPRLEKWSDKPKAQVKKWISDKNIQWVSMIVSDKSSAADFIQLCALLNDLNVGFTVCSAAEVKGWKCTVTTLFEGNLSMSFSAEKIIRIPKAPIAPKKLPNKTLHPTTDTL